MEWRECVKAFREKAPITANLGTSTVDFTMIVALQERHLLNTGQTIYQCILLDKNKHSETIVRPNQIEVKKKD